MLFEMAKNARLNLRISDEDREVLREAAKNRDMTLTEYVLEAAVTTAHMELADRNVLRVDGEEWDELNARLEEPPEHLPGLAAAFAKKPVWEE